MNNNLSVFYNSCEQEFNKRDCKCYSKYKRIYKFELKRCLNRSNDQYKKCIKNNNKINKGRTKNI